MPYLAVLAALAGIAGSLAPGPHLDSALWTAETLAGASVVEDLHANVLRAADALLGAPYHFAGSGPGRCPTGEHAVCTDCSGLVAFAYAAAGVQLPRSSSSLASAGDAVTREQLAPGDILIFRSDGSPNGQANHSGIYVGNGLFIHAGSRGVRMDDLDGPYWGEARHPRLRAIRRISR